MELVSTDSVLKIRADAVEAVRKLVDLHRPGEMEAAVGILEDWIRQQPHFRKKEFPKEYLESTIIASKGSVERAKKIIDKVCTLRTLMPDEFRPFDIRKEMELIKGKVNFVFLPKQTEDYYRVVIIRTTEYTTELLHLFYRVCYLVIDYARMYDYHRGVDIVFDLTDSNVKDAIATINFSEYANCYEIINHSYTLRVRRFIVVTSSKWVEPLVGMMKAFMKKKIADRIVIHQTLDDLHGYYPKEILPKEYGGDERCLQDLQEELVLHASSPKHKKFMQDIFETSTDESLRALDVFNDLYAGTAGTFRTLSLD